MTRPVPEADARVHAGSVPVPWHHEDGARSRSAVTALAGLGRAVQKEVAAVAVAAMEARGARVPVRGIWYARRNRRSSVLGSWPPRSASSPPSPGGIRSTTSLRTWSEGLVARHMGSVDDGRLDRVEEHLARADGAHPPTAVPGRYRRRRGCSTTACAARTTATSSSAKRSGGRCASTRRPTRPRWLGSWTRIARRCPACRNVKRRNGSGASRA